jgi:hypothetical protein
MGACGSRIAKRAARVGRKNSMRQSYKDSAIRRAQVPQRCFGLLSEAKASLHRVELRSERVVRPFPSRAAKPQASEFEFPMRTGRFFDNQYNLSNAGVMIGT